jgi:transcriptional regulator with XRE-family HTH domain
MPRQHFAPDAQRNLGLRLAQARRARGLTQEALAAALAIEPATLSRYEQGRVALTVPILLQLAQQLDISALQLLEPQTPTDTEAELLAQFRALPPEAQAGLMQFLRGLAAAR